MDTYEQLRRLDVSEHTEKKNGLSYLSWAWAVDTLLQKDPNATWEYKEEKRYGETLMVFCTVSAFGRSRTAQLPVMNYMNKAIPNPDAFQVNTAMQRCLAKAIALHGIGLYIYAGEDLPTEDGKELINTGVRVPAGVSKLPPEQIQERIGEGNVIKKTPTGPFIFTKKEEADKFAKTMENEGQSFLSDSERLELQRLVKEKNVDKKALAAYCEKELGATGSATIKKKDYAKITTWIIQHERDAQE